MGQLGDRVGLAGAGRVLHQVVGAYRGGADVAQLSAQSGFGSRTGQLGGAGQSEECGLDFAIFRHETQDGGSGPRPALQLQERFSGGLSYCYCYLYTERLRIWQTISFWFRRSRRTVCKERRRGVSGHTSRSRDAANGDGSDAQIGKLLLAKSLPAQANSAAQRRIHRVAGA